MKNISAGKYINELSRAASVYFQHEFKKYNIGHAQIRTLLFIAQNECKTQMDVAQYLNLDKSSVTSQLSVLEKNGYITRSKSERDGRKHQLNITDKTREILDPLKMVFMSWTEILLDGFSESERTEVFDYLFRMRDNAKNGLHMIKNQD